VAALPPTATVFGAFLGYNPVASLLGPTGVLAHLPKARVAFLTGQSFFPDLISGPFSSGLHEAALRLVAGEVEVPVQLGDGVGLGLGAARADIDGQRYVRGVDAAADQCGVEGQRVGAQPGRRRN
jgi:hypothetical protein